MNSLREIIRINNSEKLNSLFEGYKIEELKSILMHGYSNLLIFVFIPGNRNPEFIIKINQSGESNLKNEFDILAIIEKNMFLSGMVPKPISYCNYDGTQYFIQTALRGVNFSLSGSILNKNMLRGALTRINKELVKFNTSADRQYLLLDEIKTLQLYRDIQDVFCQDRGHNAAFSRYEGRLKNLFYRIKGMRIPFVIQHNDFWPGNILSDNGRIGIIDWDRAEKKGYPLCDLFDLLFNCSRLLYSSIFKRYVFDTLNFEKYVLNAFFGKGISNLAEEFINSYRFSLNLDAEIIKPLFLWYMARKYKNSSLLELFFRNESNFLRSS